MVYQRTFVYLVTLECSQCLKKVKLVLRYIERLMETPHILFVGYTHHQQVLLLYRLLYFI